MRQRQRKRKGRLVRLWRFMVILSFCLNVFGGYAIISKRIAKMSVIRREALKLACDGVKRRVRLFGDKLK